MAEAVAESRLLDGEPAREATGQEREHGDPSLLLVGPVAILIVLDRIGRRVLAPHPGKSGPKSPSLKKRDF